MKLTSFLKPTQEKLFAKLQKKHDKNSVVSAGKFILVQGEIPIMLLAHLDTVHAEPVKEIFISEDGNILTSPQGIGGDDRCGVYALEKIYKASKKKPYLLFTTDEEIGGVGANHFGTEFRAGFLPAELSELKLLIEIDRRGSNDAVYYDCHNPAFENYISSKGFKTAWGSFSDISIIAPILGVAAVNLSSGYYQPHTLQEFINVSELESVIQKVLQIISEIENLPKFEYAEYQSDYEEIYSELLDYYDEEELDEYRRLYGDEILSELYRLTFEY